MRLHHLFLVATSLAVVGCGGGRPYTRDEVVGMYVRHPDSAVPADEVVMVPLPPIPGVEPDTTDGGVLCAVNQRDFWRDTGRQLPAYQPRHARREELDPNLAHLARIREDLATVQKLLDRVFAAAEATERTADTPSVERQTLAELLPPDVWKRLTAGVIAITGKMTELTQGMSQPAEALDGQYELMRRSDSLWRGMMPIADQFVGAVDQLGRTGALAASGKEDRFAEDFQARMKALRLVAGDLRTIVEDRQATQVVSKFRQLQQLLDDLEISPVAGDAFGLATLSKSPRTREEREESRERLARVRVYLVRMAALWAQAQERLLTDDSRPTLVWDKPSLFE